MKQLNNQIKQVIKEHKISTSNLTASDGGSIDSGGAERPDFTRIIGQRIISQTERPNPKTTNKASKKVNIIQLIDQ